jgi:hypothetical protein
MGPDHQPVNRQGSRGQRKPGTRTGLAASPGRGSPISAALAAAGAGPEQVAKITLYVAGHRREYLPTIDAARARPVRGQQPAVDTETVVGRDAGLT